MGDSNDFTEIDDKELIDLFSDDQEAGLIIDQDELIVYNDIIWDQQNQRLKEEGVFLSDKEKKLLIMLNERISLSKIIEIEQTNEQEIKALFNDICKKFCVKNQKEANRRAIDLGLL